MSKYDSLRLHLQGLGLERWRASFGDIEKVLGFRLPASSRLHPAWWANETNAHQPHKLAWLNAGWRTTNLNMTGGTIEFVRAGAALSVHEMLSTIDQAKRPSVWLDDVLEVLAVRRPVFHSEADFQHALAWAIRETNADIPIRLEFRPFANDALYIDVWLANEPPIAIELKYPARSADMTVGRERFLLKNHSAQDLTRYDFWKDVTRLERVTTAFPGTLGFAILLTNDRSYWLPSSRPITIDAAFRLHEGRTVSGDLSWMTHAGAGTTKNRERTLPVSGRYDLSWRTYSNVGTDRYSELRYLLVAVG